LRGGYDLDLQQVRFLDPGADVTRLAADGEAEAVEKEL